MRDKVSDAYEVARPYARRIREDDELRDHVKSAYESAREIYDELIRPAGATGVAMRVASDKKLQEELRNIVEELREAGKHARGEESHKGRNMMLLLTGITLGLLFNPMTGPETRKWVREKIFGPEEPFESYGSSTNQS